MSQEATMIAVDNSDYMRNGDFFPSRLQAQKDAVSLVCQSKRQRNPENTVGLLCLANTEVLCTLTNDFSKIHSRLHMVEPKGDISFCSSIRVAQLALRHRQFRHQKMRVVCFIGSPIPTDEKELVKLAKRLKKEKVNVDVINFGENEINQTKLTAFIDALNGKDGTGSHLVSVPPGAVLSDSLVTSQIVVGDDGVGLGSSGLGLEFGIDGAEDPDLLYALRVSMEDQRMRQEHEVNAAAANTAPAEATLPVGSGSSEEVMLQQALAMSLQMNDPSAAPLSMDIDVAAMSEEDQINYALRMSLQQVNDEVATAPKDPVPKLEADVAMEVDHITSEVADKPVSSNSSLGTLAAAAESALNASSQNSTSDLDAIYDPDFLESVLQNLPGVDAQNEEVRRAINTLIKSNPKDKDSEKEPGEK